MRDYTASAVIPIYKKWSLCHSLLTDLKDNETLDEVIVVEDGSNDKEVNEGLDFWINSKLLPLHVVRIRENAGFTIASNIGLKSAYKPLATRHITFLISNDVSVKGKFVEQAADLLFSSRRYLVGNRHIVFDSGWNTFNGKTFDYLEGWFLGCTSDGWRDIGYFDEEYAPYDMEDIDLSTTAKKKGYKLAALNNPNIKHMGGGTIGFNPEREVITNRNKEYFRKKWMNEY